jgi:hypothetical protein
LGPIGGASVVGRFKIIDHKTMSPRRSLLRIAGIVFGCIGIAVCVAAMIILWVASTRLGRATDAVFSKIDHALAAVRQRVVQTETRIAAATSSAEELGDTLREWTKQEPAQRLAFQLSITERSERLAAVLRQADDSLEIAASSIGLVQDMLSIAGSTGAPTDKTLVDRLMDEIVSLRTRLGEANDYVAQIQDRFSDAAEERSLEERFDTAASFVLRTVAVLGTLEPRLVAFADSLTSAESKMQSLGERTRSWIMVITVGITLLILLMGAGQVALWRVAWNAGAWPDQIAPR